MAKTLITTPFPTTEQVARMMGISRTRQRELEALVEEIVSGKRRAKANGTSNRRKTKVKSAARKRG